jgi:hypothetical protein
VRTCGICLGNSGCNTENQCAGSNDGAHRNTYRTLFPPSLRVPVTLTHNTPRLCGRCPPRIPIMSSGFTTTVSAVRVLQRYGPTRNTAEIAERIKRGTAWLRNHEPVTTDDRDLVRGNMLGDDGTRLHGAGGILRRKRSSQNSSSTAVPRVSRLPSGPRAERLPGMGANAAA